MHRRKGTLHKKEKVKPCRCMAPLFLSIALYCAKVASYVGMIQIRYTGPGGIQPALSLLPQAPRYLSYSLCKDHDTPLPLFCQAIPFQKIQNAL